MEKDKMKEVREIVQSLLDRLSPEKRISVEEKLKALSADQEVELHEEILKAIEIEDEVSIKTIFEEEEKKIRKRVRIRQVIAFAASFLILILSYLFYGNIHKSNLDPVLALTETIPQYPNNFITLAGRDTSFAFSPVEKAFLAYEKEDFKTALNLFNEIQKNYTDPNIDFFKANALIQLNQTEEARFLLEQQIINDQARYQEEAHWFLALVYLKTNNFERAKQVLESIVSNDFYKSDEAAIILEQL